MVEALQTLVNSGPVTGAHIGTFFWVSPLASPRFAVLTLLRKIG